MTVVIFKLHLECGICWLVIVGDGGAMYFVDCISIAVFVAFREERRCLLEYLKSFRSKKVAHKQWNL